MRRWVQRHRLLLSLFIASAPLLGCDSDSFVPPPRAGKKASTAISPATPQQSKEIILILPAEDNPDIQFYDAICRLEAGNLKVIFQSFRPSPGDSKGKQAELIKKAVADGAAALIVVADGSDATVLALADVDQTKTPIILLGRPVDAPKSGPPYTLVTFPPFGASAKKIVEALLEDARKLGAPLDGTALYIQDSNADETSDARNAALTEALKAAKTPIAATVTTTENIADSHKPAVQVLKTDPKIAIIVADDDSGITIGPSLHKESKSKIYQPLGGFVQPRSGPSAVVTGQATAVVERNVEALARKAVRVALERAEGKKGPERQEVELVFRRAKYNPNPIDPSAPVTKSADLPSALAPPKLP
jgi:ABC-type sugar transport system substrate-binding protein